MNTTIGVIVLFVISFAAAWGIPALVLRFVMPALRDSEKAQATNYAGRTVVYGLGIAWVVWAIMLTISKAIYEMVPYSLDDFLFDVSTHLFNNFFYPALLVVLVCCVLGFIDDFFGVRGSGGFKGHIRALLKGRMTTGGLKMLGIGITALVAGFATILIEMRGMNLVGYARHTLLAGLAIALTANFVNLTDLRPVRASKVYLVLIFIGFGISLFSLGSMKYWDIDALWQGQLLLLAWLLGPVLATWHYDAGEVAMLGDAGANPMGAVAGLYFAFNLTWRGLLIYVIIMLALNLLSEKVSFSAVIDRTPILRTLDQLGRK